MTREYCCTYGLITLCRFFSPAQQENCAGYQPASHKHRRCVHWRNLGGEEYHCGCLEAQAWAREQYCQHGSEQEIS